VKFIILWDDPSLKWSGFFFCGKKFTAPHGLCCLTEIETVGVAVLGMSIFVEPRNLSRILCILLIVAGIAGLKLTSAQ
jgi:hypothetical protein